MKRNTIQRSLTLQAVRSMQCHPTADEVYEAVSALHPSISRGTVYRNLNQLSDEGEIREIELTGGAHRFDHCCHDHYHVRCVKCGKVFDADVDMLPDLTQLLKNVNGFQIEGYDLMFKGICPDCRKKETSLLSPKIL